MACSVVSEPYSPSSEFLKNLKSGDIALSGDAAADADLRKLIALMNDADLSNRDWATFLLAQDDIDTPEVREALSNATRDTDNCVRGEALVGLVSRDPALALPMVIGELCRDEVALPTFEAAELLAHPSLVEALAFWIEPSGNDSIDAAALQALAACTIGKRAI